MICRSVFYGSHPFDPFLYLTDTGQKFVKFTPIAVTDLAIQVRGMFFDTVKNTLGSPTALVIKETVEGQ